MNISKKEIPDEAYNLFEWYSRRFILPKEYKKWNFEKYGKINHDWDTPYITYFAIQKKDIKGIKEKNIYIYEMDEKWNKIGNWEIRLWLSDEEFFKDKPFVWFTNTKEEYRKKWYGRKRIETMNILTQKIRWMKLHSSELFSDKKAKKIRENFEQEGKAKRYKESNGSERFYMI